MRLLAQAFGGMVVAPPDRAHQLFAMWDSRSVSKIDRRPKSPNRIVDKTCRPPVFMLKHFPKPIEFIILSQTVDFNAPSSLGHRAACFFSPFLLLAVRAMPRCRRSVRNRSAFQAGNGLYLLKRHIPSACLQKRSWLRRRGTR